jgi:hypothetical protein
MTVVCVNKDQFWGGNGVSGITIDKVYRVYVEDNSGYKIMNDNGDLSFYLKERFKPLDDVRRDKLKELLGL